MERLLKSIANNHRFSVYLVIALPFLTYLSAVSFGLVRLDDNILILNNRYLLGNISNITEIFRSDAFFKTASAYYRPILGVSFMVDRLLGGVAPAMYHLTNVLLHVISCLLVFAFLGRTGASRLKALFWSLVFAVHPALTQAVAWIPGRNDSLLMIFVLLSQISLMRYLRTSRPVFLILQVLFLFLSLLTKETALAVPLVFASYLLLIEKYRIPDRRFLLLLASWVMPVAAYAVIRTATLPVRAVSLIDNLHLMLAGAPAIVSYFGKVLFPVNLSPTPSLADISVAWGIAAAAIIAAGIAFSRDVRRDRLLFGLIWFLAFLLPSLGATDARAVFYEHRLYVPIVGLFFVLREIDIPRLNDLVPFRVKGMIAASIIGIMTCMTISYSRVFENPLSFWQRAVATSPHSLPAQYGLGLAYYSTGNLEDSEKLFKNICRLSDDFGDAHTLLGMVYWNKGMIREADKEFFDAVSVRRGNCALDSALGMYGKFCLDQKRYKDAEFYLRRSIKANPNLAMSYAVLVRLYREQGRVKEAQELLDHLNSKFRISPYLLERGSSEDRMDWSGEL